MAGSKILGLGPSGGGKSSSLRNLDPKRTAIINPDRKELPIEGWIENYKTIFDSDGMPDLKKSNYVEPALASSVINVFKAWEEREDIDTIVTDTATQMIVADYVDNAIGKDYSGYQKMGKNFYSLMDLVRDSKKNVIVFAHSEIIFNEMGDRVIQMTSPGKMIHSFSPPSFFTTVLITHMERKDKKNRYYFRTQPEANNDPVKSPVRFKGEEVIPCLEFLEPNDMKLILEKLEAFRKGSTPPTPTAQKEKAK